MIWFSKKTHQCLGIRKHISSKQNGHLTRSELKILVLQEILRRMKIITLKAKKISYQMQSPVLIWYRNVCLMKPGINQLLEMNHTSLICPYLISKQKNKNYMNEYISIVYYLHSDANSLPYLHIYEDKMDLNNEFVNCILDYLVKTLKWYQWNPRMKPKKRKTLMIPFLFTQKKWVCFIYKIKQNTWFIISIIYGLVKIYGGIWFWTTQ